MEKHTPGPWRYEYGAVYTTDKDGVNVRLLLADRNTPDTEPTERDSNLRLAAAAPDLLIALKGIAAALNQNHTFPADIEAARIFAAAAISKVEA